MDVFSHAVERWWLERALPWIFRYGTARCTLCRLVPCIYEQHKTWLGRLSRTGTGSWWVVSTSGLCAGTLATILTHPFDILKTRLQTTPAHLLHSSANGQMKLSLFATARHILSSDGWQAFCDGLGLRCARKAASSMIGWSIFEIGHRWVSIT